MDEVSKIPLFVLKYRMQPAAAAFKISSARFTFAARMFFCRHSFDIGVIAFMKARRCFVYFWGFVAGYVCSTHSSGTCCNLVSSGSR